MIRQKSPNQGTNRGDLMTSLVKRLCWGMPVLGLAGLIAVLPPSLQGAQKDKEKATSKAAASKDTASKDKDAKADAKSSDGESKESSDSSSSVKLPEPVYSTGYNGSYVD